MNYKNFQARAWDDTFSRGIYDLMKSQSFSYEGITVTFAPENASSFLKAIVDGDSTISKTLKVKISFADADSCLETTASLIDLPILTDSGLVIDGTKWTIINTSHPASGWYLLRDKDGKLILSLQRGAAKVITISIPLPTARDAQASVTITGRRGKSSTMPLFAFLKAVSCNPSCTYAEIADMLSDCSLIQSAYYNDYVNITSEKRNTPKFQESSLAACADALLHHITGYAADYTWADSVAELQQRLNNNSLRIGEEKIPRFKRLVSFARAKGTLLNKDVTLSSGQVIKAGEIITDSIIRLLDSDKAVDFISINYQDREFILKKFEPDMTLSFDEILCVLRVYDQALSGLTRIDEPDQIYNKVINSIREDYEKRIENALNGFIRAIMKQINSHLGSAKRKVVRNDDLIAQLASYDYSKLKVTLKDVYKSMTGEAYYQQFDETNSLSTFDQSYKLTTTAKNVTSSARDIQSMQYGRICPYTTSESKQVGLNLALTLFSELDKYGFITTPIYRFTKGSLAEEVTYISAIDELTEVIAPAETDLVQLWNEHPNDPSFLVPNCRIDGELVSAPITDVTAKYMSGVQTLGPLPASAPGANMNSPKRLIMCASAQRQALVPLKAERPFVTTGIEGVYEIGITTADTMIRDYLIAHGESGDLADDACVYYGSAYKHANKLFVTFDLINNGKSYKFEKCFDNCKSTLNGSVKYLRLAPPQHATSAGRYYKGNDIVFYNSDVDLSEADFAQDTVNFDTVKFSSDKLKHHGVAIGNNCKVLFKSFDGYTYEDSIEVTESFLARRGLAVIKTTSVKFTLHKSRKEHVEFRANEHGVIPQLDSTGYPINGYYVQTGQDILATVSMDEDGETHFGTKKVGIGQSGFIIGHHQFTDHNNSDNVIVVIDLGDILDVTLGDKLEGLHGNKGVIGRILKDSEVPYTEDGEVPDIILNPFGILARLNIGQIPECTLGKICEKTGKIQILEPFANRSVEDIAALAKEYDLVEKDLYDARTGLKYPRKAFIGNMYMLRLEHISTSKYNATSDCKGHMSARTGQPQGGAGGGQRMSELCTWCVTAYGATTTLDSLFTAQSDAIKAKQTLDMSIKHRESTDIKYRSNNLDFLQAYFQMMGAHLAVSDEGVRVELLTQKYIDKCYPNRCRIDLLNRGSMTPKALLHDDSIFGKDFKNETNRTLFAQLPFSEDNSCEIIMPLYLKSDSVISMFRYAYYQDGVIQTDCKTPHNSFFNDIVKGTKCIVGWKTYSTEEALKKLLADQYGVVLPDTYELPIIVPVSTVKKEVNTGKTETRANSMITAEARRTGTGIRAVVSLFKRYDLRASLCRKISGKPCSENTSLINKKEFPHLTDIVLFLRNYSLQDFIVTSMVIPPVGYRAVNMSDAKMSNPIDAKLNDVVNAIRLLGVANTDGNRARRETELYNTISKITFEATDSSDPSLKDQLVDHKTKSSIMRDTLLSKRLSYTGRSVITIGSDLEFGECGVPICMLTTIFDSHIAAEICDTSKHYMLQIIGKHVKNNSTSYFKHLCEFVANNNLHGFQNYTLGRMTASTESALAELKEEYESTTGSVITLNSVNDLFDICYTQLIDILNMLLKTHPTLLNREPSLHKFSIQGQRAKPIDSYALQLHPLNCHGYNADYDGDQMAALFPMVEAAMQDVEDKMMSENNIIDPKDGSGIIALNQDMILGLYYATMHKDNSLVYKPDCIHAVYTLDCHKHITAPYGKSVGVAEDITRDIYSGLLDIHDTILCIYNERKYIAEAGRFLVNALLPDGIGFTTQHAPEILGYSDLYSLAVNYTLSKNTIGNVEKLCINYFTKYGLGKDPYGDSLGAFYNRLMYIGFRMADLSGVTLSIYDLISLPVKAIISDELERMTKTEKELNEWYNLGFCTAEGKDSIAVIKWQKTIKSLKKLLEKAFNSDPEKITSGPKFDRMSNIFMIVDSGARGNVSQLLELAGLVGIVTNSSGKAMATPILTSYLDGLTPGYFMQNAYTGRRQTAAAQLTTAEAGEFNRHCIYLAEHLHINTNGGHCDAHGTWIPLEYNVVFSDNDRREDNLVVTEEEFAAVPDSIWLQCEFCYGKRDLAVAYYNSYMSNITALLQSTVISDEVVHMLQLYRAPFIITRDSKNKYHYVTLSYELTKDSKSMLHFRVLDVSELENNPDTSAYADIWSRHGENILCKESDEIIMIDDKAYSLADEVVIGDTLIHDIEVAGVSSVPIYTTLKCTSTTGICQRCFGVKYDTHTFPDWGESVGYQAVQAVGNPITQLILDSHKLDASSEESAETKLKRILSNNHTEVPSLDADTRMTLPIATTASKVTIEIPSENKHIYIITLTDDTGAVIQSVPITSLSGLKVKTNENVVKGQPLAGITAGQYGYWMALTDTLNIQVDIWKQLCNCFSNETIYARNFEIFARSLTEFGRAETTDLSKGIVRNEVYRTSFLRKNNISYVPEYLSMRNAMAKSNKVLANIALSNACENMVSAVVSGAVNTSDSNVGSALIGDYKTATGKLQTVSIIGQFTSMNPEAINTDLIQTEDISILEERSSLAVDAYEEKSESVETLLVNTDFTTYNTKKTDEDETPVEEQQIKSSDDDLMERAADLLAEDQKEVKTVVDNCGDVTETDFFSN